MLVEVGITTDVGCGLYYRVLGWECYGMGVAWLTLPVARVCGSYSVTDVQMLCSYPPGGIVHMTVAPAPGPFPCQATRKHEPQGDLRCRLPGGGATGRALVRCEEVHDLRFER